MILKLILKDIKAYQNLIFLRILVPMAILNSLFSLKFYPVGGYIIAGCMVIVVASSLFSFSEKSRNTEILTRSLPVTNLSVVIARYFTTAIISMSGMVLYYLSAYIVSFIYDNAMTCIDDLNHLKILFVAISFLSIHTSIFIPAVFRLRLLGSILTFIIGMVAAILTTVFFFNPYKLSFKPSFEPDDFLKVGILAIIIVLALMISTTLSTFFYRKRVF
jgi:hypothetical protein